MSEEDLAFMLNPMNWPLFPFLPLKKRNPIVGDFPLFGTLVAGMDGFSFYLEFVDTVRFTIKTPVKRGGIELLKELVDDGWRVD